LEYLLYIIADVVMLFLKAEYALLLLRVVLSWIDLDPDNEFVNFIFLSTEIVVSPIRALYEKLEWFENTPFDMSFITAILLIYILLTTLPTVIL